jgi:Mg2+-importing ATPase
VNTGTATRTEASAGTFSPRTPRAAPADSLAEWAALDADEVMRRLRTTTRGLTGIEAAARLDAEGPNALPVSVRTGWPWRLLRAVRNPLVVLLVVLAGVARLTGDTRAAGVITLMIILGVLLRFVQETHAGAAADKLRSMIHVTATVVRDGEEVEVPLRGVVRGDVVLLAAGDMIPADVRLLSAKDVFVNQAALTGESMPVEKSDLPDRRPNLSAHELRSLCFLGTSVESGAARAVVLATGSRTTFGDVARRVVSPDVITSFDRGVTHFTWLMIGLISVMVPLVFLVNGVTKHDWREAFFFALAVAVGLTPEMLPMIVSVSLARGAVAMSRRKVIVKRLNAIQNFGAMDVLCTDKTGTLTMERVILERHCDLTGADSEPVLLQAFLVSHFQTGLRNVLDRAILAHRESHPLLDPSGWVKVDEIPFDFSRRIMSVVVDPPDGSRRLIAKGATDEIIRRCSGFEISGAHYPVAPALLDGLREQYESLSSEGFRVLAVAYREVPERPAYSTDDESQLTLCGYVAFLDPPKETAGAALASLARAGITVKVLTGDNELVSRTICRHVALPAERVLLGAEIDGLSDEELATTVQETSLCARLSPAHKERIVRVLRGRGHTVGFLGDGINDAPALRAADVGISVDSAVDIARESADIILLEKSLLVLHEGAIEGRKVFSNILKYVRMGASSNFGNMFSVLGASALLPFVPMAPIQVLTNNLLYDCSQVPIPTDDVDVEQVQRPRPWSIRDITRFIFFIGPISSLFDYTTFAMMWFLFGARTVSQAALFQTGWFVESLMTQTLIIHVIRTNRIPFFQSRASWPVLATTILIVAIGVWLPVSPLAASLGFVALPARYWPLLAATVLLYMLLTQGVKMLLLRKGWIGDERPP